MFFSPNLISNLLQGLEMHTKPWVRARASKEYWQNMNPAGEEQFSFQSAPFAYRKPFFKKCLFLIGHRLGGGRDVNSCLDRLGLFPTIFWWAFSVVSCLWEFRKGLPVCWFVCVKACFFVLLYMFLNARWSALLSRDGKTGQLGRHSGRQDARAENMIFLKYTFIKVRLITPLWVPLSGRCRLCYESIIPGHPGQEKVSEDMLYTMCALFRSKESSHSRLVTPDSMSIWARSKARETK